jgi:hypothetical protein
LMDLKKRVTWRREKMKKEPIAATCSPSVLNRNRNHIASTMKRDAAVCYQADTAKIKYFGR